MAEVKEPKVAEAEAATPEKKDLSQLPSWNCRVEGSPKEAQWTVGEVFHLNCEGPKAEFLSTELQFKSSEKFHYQLRVLEVEKQTDNSLYMKVTSYNPGQHNFEKLYIMDQGEEVVSVEPIAFSVKSVIEKPDQKPYGPIMAFRMTYPSWLWMSLSLVFAMSLFFLIFKWRRRLQMRKVIEELKQHNTALGAFNQFNKDIRLLGRKYIFGKKEEWAVEKKHRYVESLDGIFRMYLLREFYVPALDWNSSLVLKTISKQDKKSYSLYGDDLQKFLKELDRAMQDSEKLKNHDCKQLTQMAKRVTQSIWKVRK